jgi:hypothetical protein
VLGSFNQGGARKGDDEGEEGAEDGEKGAKKKRKNFVSTIETNPDNLNFKTAELMTQTDPMFKKTSGMCLSPLLASLLCLPPSSVVLPLCPAALSLSSYAVPLCSLTCLSLSAALSSFHYTILKRPPSFQLLSTKAAPVGSS